MQKSKRNHWVAQSYLRSFAADERGEKIWRFSKNGGNPEQKPIDKVAVRFYLYAPKDAAGVRDYSFEHKLAGLEQFFGHELWLELGTGMVDLQWEPVRKMVALLAASMYRRTPGQFENWKRVHRQLVTFLSADSVLPASVELGGRTYPLDATSWPSYRDASEEDLKKAWLKTVGDAASIAQMLMKMRWAIVFSDEPVFITSDNPVAITHPSLDFRGITDAETSLIFPLSPTRVLCMDNRHDQPDGRYYPLQNAAALNLTIWRAAHEYMFSHRHTDDVCAELLADAQQHECA